MRRTFQRDASHPAPSEITPESAWLGRRDLLRRAAQAGIAFASSAVPWRAADAAAPVAAPAALPSVRSSVAGAFVMDKPTPREDAVTYNNFYEFGLDKRDPAAYASAMPTRPWAVAVEGLVGKPRTFDIDTLLKLAPMEDRIYRLRCVEGWSMVIPWIGWSLGKLLAQVEPLGSAKFVVFETLADRTSMPGVRSPNAIPFPYREALRLDEALHPLTLLAFGFYGQVLANQNGAPVRLVVPWKYGFKSAKSLVRIRLVETQPTTTWGQVAPAEYGFYANVNPDVDHPRWSQARERRIGEDGLFTPKRPTLMFNGYAPQVASLYSGMDLRRAY